MSSPLYIDDRAGSQDLMAYDVVKQIAEITRLPYGDAMIVGNGPDDAPLLVGVEVKSIHDLISSINTGRIVDQLRGMVGDEHTEATFGVSWLLWFGSIRPGKEGRLEIKKGPTWRPFKIGDRYVPYGYLQSFLFDVASLGVQISHVYDEAEAAAWLYCLHRWWSKSWKDHKGLRTVAGGTNLGLMPGMDPATRLRTCIANQLPGVGFDRAYAVAKHFTSIRSMVNADPEEWAEIVVGERKDGVQVRLGKVVAKAVVAAME